MIFKSRHGYIMRWIMSISGLINGVIVGSASGIIANKVTETSSSETTVTISPFMEKKERILQTMFETIFDKIVECENALRCNNAHEIDCAVAGLESYTRSASKSMGISTNDMQGLSAASDAATLAWYIGHDIAQEEKKGDEKDNYLIEILKDRYNECHKNVEFRINEFRDKMINANNQ